MNNKTFAIIKPDAVKNNFTGKIYNHILESGFKILCAKLFKMSKNQAEDFYTFVASGPGSIKGLNYFFERKPELIITNARFKKELEIVREYMDKKEDQPLYLCNQDLQNCLCEYSKYMRVLYGGRTKRNYQGL